MLDARFSSRCILAYFHRGILLSAHRKNKWLLCCAAQVTRQGAHRSDRQRNPPKPRSWRTSAAPQNARAPGINNRSNILWSSVPRTPLIPAFENTHSKGKRKRSYATRGADVKLFRTCFPKARAERSAQPSASTLPAAARTAPGPAAAQPPLTFSIICRSFSSPAASSCSSSASMAGVITTSCSPISAPGGSATTTRAVTPGPGPPLAPARGPTLTAAARHVLGRHGGARHRGAAHGRLAPTAFPRAANAELPRGSPAATRHPPRETENRALHESRERRRLSRETAQPTRGGLERKPFWVLLGDARFPSPFRGPCGPWASRSRFPLSQEVRPWHPGLCICTCVAWVPPSVQGYEVLLCHERAEERLKVERELESLKWRKTAFPKTLPALK